MVQMFCLNYKGKDNRYFSNGFLYVGRRTKSGDIAARASDGRWVMVDEGKMTIQPFSYNFDIVHTFHLPTHKEALAYHFPTMREELKQ